MNEQELAELKFLQFKIEEAKHNYLLFLQSKNYKIKVYNSYEESEVTAVHKDYLNEDKSYRFRYTAKDDSPDWAEIILFDLDSLLETLCLRVTNLTRTKPE